MSSTSTYTRRLRISYVLMALALLSACFFGITLSPETHHALYKLLFAVSVVLGALASAYVPTPPTQRGEARESHISFLVRIPTSAALVAFIFEALQRTRHDTWHTLLDDLPTTLTYIISIFAAGIMCIFAWIVFDVFILQPYHYHKRNKQRFVAR